MALTDRSTVPLKPSDFRVLQGERRLSDVRLAERLGFSEPNQIRKLIQRWESFLEQQSGKVVHGERLSGARGFAGDAYWLTIPELIFIAGQSKARNAPVVQYEAAQIAAYWVTGEQPPEDAAPTIRALAAPDLPKVIPTVVPPSVEQAPDLFSEAPAPASSPVERNVERNERHIKALTGEADRFPHPAQWSAAYEHYASTWAGDVPDEPPTENLLIGERTPPASWGQPLVKNKAHHLRKTGGSFLCQCFMLDGKLAEFLIACEPVRAVNMRERLLLRYDPEEFLCRFDWGVGGINGHELLTLERACERSPLSERQAEAVLTLLLGG